jgi:nucleotide-binding universal stress UspA family protein
MNDVATTRAVRHIVLGFDGSQGSFEARDWLAPVAASLGAEVTVVRAYSPLDELGHHPDGLDFPAMRDEAAEQLATVVAAPLQDAGVPCRTELIEDQPPHEVLARAAADLGADLLVVGSHGSSGWRERLVGSVASKLLEVAPCAVVVVPQAAPHDH